MTVALEGTIVYEQQGSERMVHRCATRRVAQVLATTTELRAAGWSIDEIRSADKPRLPLLLPGERMMSPLDGSRSDERAQGFVATRGGDRLGVDACAGMAPVSFGERGDTTEARWVAEYYLGPLA